MYESVLMCIDLGAQLYGLPLFPIGESHILLCTNLWSTQEKLTHFARLCDSQMFNKSGFVVILREKDFTQVKPNVIEL